jgi:hypothetical protein
MFWTTFGVFIFFLTLESITSWIFIRGSRKKHPDLWVHAGEPTLMGNGDLISAWPLVKYILFKQYRDVPDQKAVSFAEKNRMAFLLSYFSACISVLVFFLAWFAYGTPK